MSDDRDALNRLRRRVDELSQENDRLATRLQYFAVSLDQLRDNLASDQDVRQSLMTFVDQAYGELTS